MHHIRPIIPKEAAVYGLQQLIDALLVFLRPPMPAIDMSVVVASEPSLHGKTLSHARSLVTSNHDRMVEGILGTGIACPEGDEKSVAADFRGIRLPGLPPTHVLFLRNRYGVVEAWLPCHSTSLLVHCAVLPILPCYRVSYKALAVVNMTLPSPTTFYIIRDFTYSRSVPAMMSQLLPRFPAMPLKAEEDGLDAMSAAHATLSDEELTERAARVNGVYQNACVVAIADDEFWSCLDLARRILLNTFAMRCMEGL